MESHGSPLRWTRVLILIAAVALQILCSSELAVAQGDGQYAVVASNTFRPGVPYIISLSLFSSSSPVDFTVELSETTRQETLVSDQVQLSAISRASSASLSLQIPTTVADGTYMLNVKGSGGLTFTESRSVSLSKKQLSIFIQTDKSYYKPGQTVLFRCLAVYSNLLPFKKEMNLTVFDQSGNKIAQWLNLVNSNGVNGQQLRLADQTPLGVWNIQCTAGGYTVKQEFTVAEYVLPKFEVKAFTPSFYFVNINQKSLQKDLFITVTATYTYGQPVKGRATVNIEIMKDQGETENSPAKTIDVELIEGTAQVPVTVDDLVALVPTSSSSLDPWAALLSRTVLVSASVLETVTGVTLQDNATVSCVSSRYKLNFVSTPDRFRIGMLLYGYLELSQWDGSPPNPNDLKDPATGDYRFVQVEATISAGDLLTDIKSFNVKLTDSGYMMFYMQIPDICTGLSLAASFNDVDASSTISASKTLSPFNIRDSEAGIQIRVSGTDTIIKPNSKLSLTVTTTTAVKTIMYQVLSKGLIVISDTVTSQTASTLHTLKLIINSDIAQSLFPIATFTVWYRTDSLEIISDTVKLTVIDSSTNQVSLRFNKDTVAPSDNVSLSVTACSGSYVGLVAVDQSAILLNPGNRFTQQSVENDIEKYSAEDTSGGTDVEENQNPVFRRWPKFVDGQDTFTQLDNAGLIMISDCFVYYPQYVPMSTTEGMSVDQKQFFLLRNPKPGASVTPPRSTRPPSETDTSNLSPGNEGKTLVKPSLIRKNFVETWIWTDKIAGPDNSVRLTAQIPDTMTKWIASAFAVNDDCGLGVTENDAEVTVFQPFFISITAPPSVVRGEEFAYLVTIFNYLSNSLAVKVTLKKSKDFNVRQSRNPAPHSADVVITITVPANDARTAYFWIVPVTLGQIPINVQAQSNVAADAVRTLLLVKPEGVERSYSTAMLIQLANDDYDFSHVVNCSLPPKNVLVPGSQRITCTAIGDVLGPSIKGLDRLVQMPSGCGEQNMLNLAPIVYVMDYLIASGQDTPDLMELALSYMINGYQRELTYQREDGSLSAFGSSDSSGSTWLSAFVAKVFFEAKQYIPVEDDKLAKILNWVMVQQTGTGSFNEPGRVIHTDMQGGSSRGVPLTAYVLISLCMNKDNIWIDKSQYSRTVTKGLAFLKNQLNTISKDPYSLSIVIDAFMTCGYFQWTTPLYNLKSLAINKDGKMHWERPKKDAAGSENVAGLDGRKVNWVPPQQQSPSVDIELTSYALLVFVHEKDVTRSASICKWLVGQMNSFGGFSSTQDTVMALEALNACARMLSSYKVDDWGIDVSVTAGRFSRQFKKINSETALLLQEIEIPSTSTSVEISAHGKGTAVVQINVKYNVYNVINSNGIILDVNTNTNDNEITLNICGSWTGIVESGMCVMEVTLLTGYEVLNVDAVRELTSGSVMRIEMDTEKIVLYYNELTKTPNCLSLTLHNVLMVNNVQRALITLYRYYDKYSIGTAFYGPTGSGPAPSYCAKCAKCCGDS